MSTIRDLPSAWRDGLLPAHFDGYPFHVEAHALQNGRRIVLHEFSKKDLPYAEDMGRSAFQFTVRGYCIQFPLDFQAPLWMRDYRIARDLLAERLDTGGPGKLQLPTATAKRPPIFVVCSRYTLSEENRTGGYCVFDMTFVEVGAPPFKESISSETQLLEKAGQLESRVLETLR
jgi:hypothetical protein